MSNSTRLPTRTSTGSRAVLVGSIDHPAQTGLGLEEEAIKSAKRAVELQQELWGGRGPDDSLFRLDLMRVLGHFGEDEYALEVLEVLFENPYHLPIQVLEIDPFLSSVRQHAAYLPLIEAEEARDDRGGPDFHGSGPA